MPRIAVLLWLHGQPGRRSARPAWVPCWRPDARSHASLVDACRPSRARVVQTPHRDVDAVDCAATRDEQRAVVVTDSVFSADGSLAPVRELLEVCRRHGALLLRRGVMAWVWRGRGLLRVRSSGAPDVVMTTTLSKALARVVWCSADAGSGARKTNQDSLCLVVTVGRLPINTQLN